MIWQKPGCKKGPVLLFIQLFLCPKNTCVLLWRWYTTLNIRDSYDRLYIHVLCFDFFPMSLSGPALIMGWGLKHFICDRVGQTRSGTNTSWKWGLDVGCRSQLWSTQSDPVKTVFPSELPWLLRSEKSKLDDPKKGVSQPESSWPPWPSLLAAWEKKERKGVVNWSWQILETELTYYSPQALSQSPFIHFPVVNR